MVWYMIHITFVLFDVISCNKMHALISWSNSKYKLIQLVIHPGNKLILAPKCGDAMNNKLNLF